MQIPIKFLILSIVAISTNQTICMTHRDNAVNPGKIRQEIFRLQRVLDQSTRDTARLEAELAEIKATKKRDYEVLSLIQVAIKSDVVIHLAAAKPGATPADILKAREKIDANVREVKAQISALCKREVAALDDLKQEKNRQIVVPVRLIELETRLATLDAR